MGLLLLMGTSGVPFSGALDNASSNLASAWSVCRRLRAGYTSNIIRVRRSSDNAESDFGYQADGTVSSAAIASFCGAGDGFLTTIYDQSGNGRNLTQTSTTIQPIICESGTVVTEGSRIAAKFVEAAIRRMEVSSSTALYNFLHTTGGSVTFVTKPNNTATPKAVFSTKLSLSVAGATFQFATNENPGVNVGRLDVAGVATNGNSVTWNANSVTSIDQCLLWYNVDPDNGTAANRCLGWRNGTAFPETNADTGTPFVENTTSNLTVGARVSNLPMDGTIQEIVIWSSIQSNDVRDAYESNAGAFYGLTVA